MSNELFTADGQRKYLTSDERERFPAAAARHHRNAVRTFCMVMAYTGCRISEALQLTADRVDLAAKTLTFQTLKQRGKTRFRAIHAVVDEYLEDCANEGRATEKPFSGQFVMRLDPNLH